MHAHRESPIWSEGPEPLLADLEQRERSAIAALEAELAEAEEPSERERLEARIEAVRAQYRHERNKVPYGLF